MHRGLKLTMLVGTTIAPEAQTAPANWCFPRARHVCYKNLGRSLRQVSCESPAVLPAPDVAAVKFILILRFTLL